MASSLGQVAIGLGAAAAAYPLTRLWDNHVDRKRKADEAVDLTFDLKRQRVASNFVSTPNMGFKRRSRFRKRFRRPRRRRTFRKKRFARSVKRVILRTIEPRKVVAADFQQSFSEEDAVGPVAYINCPPSVLVQGTQEDQVTGNKCFLKGMVLRGHMFLSVTTPSVTGAMVLVTAIWTKEQGTGFHGGFIAYTSTTTSAANPAQVPPDTNPRLFNAVAPFNFTGDKFRYEFDRTNVKVLKQWRIPINPGGQDSLTIGSMPVLFKLYCPINRMIQFEDPGELGLSATPRRFKYGNYYFVLQVVTGVANGANDTIINGDFRSEVFLRDI